MVADPPAPADLGLGQLVKLTGGRFVVVRFGGGSAGDIVVVKSDGTSSVVPGLDVARRRIGLTVAADGTLFSSWFTKTGQNPRVGSLGRLDPVADTETPIVESLGKPACSRSATR